MAGLALPQQPILCPAQPLSVPGCHQQEGPGMSTLPQGSPHGVWVWVTEGPERGCLSLEVAWLVVGTQEATRFWPRGPCSFHSHVGSPARRCPLASPG